MGFWDQFELHTPTGAPVEQGGITGQPNVDPSQLQVPQIDYSKMDPNTAARLQTEAAGYGYGGRQAGETDEQYRSRVSVMPSASSDQPRTNFGDARDQQPYEQNYYGDRAQLQVVRPQSPQEQQFNQFYRDYWAPDRAQVLASMRAPQFGSLSQLGQLFNTNGPLSAQGQTSSSVQGVANAIFHHVRTPDGRLVQVPQDQLQQALSRGGTHAGGPFGGATSAIGSALKGFGGLF